MRFGRIIGFGLFLALLSIQFALSTSTMAATTTVGVNEGGFLFPFDFNNGIATLTTNKHEAGPNGWALDFTQGPGIRFEILAPKDGVVIYQADEVTDDWHGKCPEIATASNYLVLGHGPRKVLDGTYPFYTVYLHLSTESVRFDAGARVRVGEILANAGRTGMVEGKTGIHLHFFGTAVLPPLRSKMARKCGASSETLTRQWLDYSTANMKRVGFEEYANQWPLLGNEDATGQLRPSFNHQGLQPNECNPDSRNLILYEHRDYGGECFFIDNPSQNVNVPNDLGPGGLNVSSMYLNPSYFGTHLLHVFDGYNSTRYWMLIQGSASQLGTWNDRIKSLHNSEILPNSVA